MQSYPPLWIHWNHCSTKFESIKYCLKNDRKQSSMGIKQYVKTLYILERKIRQLCVFKVFEYIYSVTLFLGSGEEGQLLIKLEQSWRWGPDFLHGNQWPRRFLFFFCCLYASCDANVDHIGNADRHNNKTDQMAMFIIISYNNAIRLCHLVDKSLKTKKIPYSKIFFDITFVFVDRFLPNSCSQKSKTTNYFFSPV